MIHLQAENTKDGQLPPQLGRGLDASSLRAAEGTDPADALISDCGLPHQDRTTSLHPEPPRKRVQLPRQWAPV